MPKIQISLIELEEFFQQGAEFFKWCGHKSLSSFLTCEKQNC